MPSTRRLLIVVGILLCAFVSTGCEPVEPTSGKIGQIWLVDETYSPADEAVEARMNEIVPKVQFSGTPFKDVVQSLRKTGKVSIHVKWCALEIIGVKRTSTVSVDLTNVTFAKALQIILDNVSGVTPMGYLIDKGVITISHCDDLSRYTVTRIYDINDLIDRPKPAFPDKALLVEVIRKAIHRPIKAPKKDDAETLADAYQERIEELAEEIMDELPGRYTYIHDLMDLIRTTVDLTSWRGGEACGEIGSIMAFDGKLIITQTHNNHRTIRALLSAMREQTSTLPAWKKSASK
ncbi:MAG: STN domain-containing protein [Phycisphaerae bacterium]|nr:STN domain-containing protein [Phycisphaerae bacterium]